LAVAQDLVESRRLAHLMVALGEVAAWWTASA